MFQPDGRVVAAETAAGLAMARAPRRRRGPGWAARRPLRRRRRGVACRPRGVEPDGEVRLEVVEVLEPDRARAAGPGVMPAARSVGLARLAMRRRRRVDDHRVDAARARRSVRGGSGRRSAPGRRPAHPRPRRRASRRPRPVGTGAARPRAADGWPGPGRGPSGRPAGLEPGGQGGGGGRVALHPEGEWSGSRAGRGRPRAGRAWRRCRPGRVRPRRPCPTAATFDSLARHSINHRGLLAFGNRVPACC